MNYKKINKLKKLTLYKIDEITKVAAVSQVNIPTKGRAFAGLLVNPNEP
jgi:sporulation protein YlmC with PRC-barrel domain